MTAVAVCMGDPCGIGPEIVLKALSDPGLADQCLVIGDARLLTREATRLSLPMPAHVLDVGPDCSGLAPGRPDVKAGDASFGWVQRAIDEALAGRVQAVVTAPIAKESWHLAGHRFPGHTELLSSRCGDVPVRMMLANRELRVVLVSIHMALREAIANLSSRQIRDTIHITDQSLRKLGISMPRIAVAGLNPHAGEGGLFGSEEYELIAPAITECRQDGINVSGPFAPDTIFMRARGLREFDVVIAMYHDQGLIPVKYLGIDDGVNVTLGLPFLRTSPDHGTAFDIAGRVNSSGQGLADSRSMSGAIAQALAWLRLHSQTRPPSQSKPPRY